MGDREEIERIEKQIAELKSRWPSHSVPPAMWDELDSLEVELEEAKKKAGETTYGGKTSLRRLP